MCGCCDCFGCCKPRSGSGNINQQGQQQYNNGYDANRRYTTPYGTTMNNNNGQQPYADARFAPYSIDKPQPVFMTMVPMNNNNNTTTNNTSTLTTATTTTQYIPPAIVSSLNDNHNADNTNTSATTTTTSNTNNNKLPENKQPLLGDVDNNTIPSSSND
eukprot:UN09564